MVDYCWTMACAQATSVLRMAYLFAFLEIPEGCDNHEMTRVQHIINGKGIRGAKVNKQYRTLPTKGNRQSLQMAKQSKRIGRLHELL